MRHKTTKTRSRKSLGAQLVEGLQEFEAAVTSGLPLEARLTVRTYKLDLTPREFDGEAVKVVRAKLGASQAIFAQLLGASVDLVQSWEQAIRVPSKMARRLLEEMDEEPERWRRRLQRAAKVVD